MTTYEDELESPFATELFEAPRAQTVGVGSAAITAIEATKQGKLAGDNGTAGGRVRVTRLGFTVVAPRDVATGMASGKRRYQPLTFRCDPGPLTPQLFQALVANEVLKVVRFELSRADRSGQQTTYLTIELTGVTLSGLQTIQEPGQPPAMEVALAFERIEMNASGRVANDTWVASP